MPKFTQIPHHILRALTSAQNDQNEQNNNVIKEQKTIEDFSHPKCQYCVSRFEENRTACNKCDVYEKYVCKLEETYTSLSQESSHTYKPFLSINATKLLILILNYAEKGFVNHMHYKFISSKINCSDASTYSAIRALEKCGFIKVIKDNGFYDFCVINYNDMYKKHGDGYITVSDTVIDSLFQIKTINELRYALIILDINNGTTEEKNINYSKITSTMPSYVRPHHIIKAAENVLIFEVRTFTRFIQVKLKDMFSASVLRKKLIDDLVPEIKRIRAQISYDIEIFRRHLNNNYSSDDDNFFYPKLIEDISTKTKKYGEPYPFELPEQCYKDFALQAIKYSIKEVEKAMIKIYSHYTYTKTINTVSDYVKLLNKLITSERNKNKAEYNLVVS